MIEAVLRGERTWHIEQGDALEVLRKIPDESVDAVVTDPPYALEFMGHEWDSFDPMAYQNWCSSWAKEVFRLLKPGGHLLAFSGTRTHHRLWCAVEDAGFEIRDMIGWIYGQGFPKSLSVSKFIDKVAGAKRQVVGKYQPPNGQEWNLKQSEDEETEAAPGTFTASGRRTLDVTAPATEDAKKWDGWGTALKPSIEPIVLARKPLIGSVVANVLKHGTGGINIDGARIASTDVVMTHSRTAEAGKSKGIYGDRKELTTHQTDGQKLGRWPANVIFSHVEGGCVLKGTKKVKGAPHLGQKNPDLTKQYVGGTFGGGRVTPDSGYSDADGMETVEDWECVQGCPITELDVQTFELDGSSGSASRFFYCAKADSDQRWFYCRICKDAFRDEGSHATHAMRCDTCQTNYTREDSAATGMERLNQGLQEHGYRPNSYAKGGEAKHAGHQTSSNFVIHPTQKPEELMEWLCRLVTPPEGVVLDPFAGSGTTGAVALRQGFRFIGIERQDEYIPIARRRVEGDMPLFNTLK